MRLPLTLSLLSLLTTTTFSQGVTDIVVPSSTPPTDCANSRSGTFQITIQNVTTPSASASSADAEPFTTFAKRFDSHHATGAGAAAPNPQPHLLPRQLAGILTITLQGGVLTDQSNRTGYIASNYQFQFDGPPQAGAIYTGGFTLCSNGSLALGGSAVFYQCLSGTFFNLYDRNWAEHCNAVYILAIGGAGAVFTTPPPGPVSTGASEATIENGGGTASSNATGTATTGVGIGAGGTGSATATQTSEETAASESAADESATSEGAATSSSSSDGAPVPTGFGVTQKVLGWGVGLFGAVIAF